MGKALQTLVLACLLTLPSLAGETSKLIASRITSSAAVPSLPVENSKIAFSTKPACVFRLRAS